MSITESSPTLFYDLISPRPGLDRKAFPATDLVYKLLHHVAADVSSFRRNCQVSYRLIECARDIYDAINTRIFQAEVTGSWEDYDAHNRAIPPLEEVLLSIMEVTEIERDEYLVGSTGYELVESMAGWIEHSIADWQKHRDEIRKFLDMLRAEEAFKCLIDLSEDYGDEMYDVKAHDDQTFLQNLLTSLGNNERRLSVNSKREMIRKARETLQSVLDLLKASPKTIFEQELIDLAIKCAMTAYGVTEIIIMDREEVKLDPEFYDWISGENIWETAVTLAVNLHGHLKCNDQAPTLSELSEIYARLEAWEV